MMLVSDQKSLGTAWLATGMWGGRLSDRRGSNRHRSRVRSLLAATAAAAMLLVMPASAHAVDCGGDFTYNGACGPEFESPAWGDAAGWTDPSKYSTIQLADITGNGTDELIARNDDGLEIWTFDTSVGQWRQAIGANGLAEVLPDFRSPLPTEDVRGSWQDPASSSTIQTADLFGDGESEIIANHEPTGTRVWRYTPPPGSKSINGGSWSLVSTNTILPSSPAPSQYLSLHAVGAGFLPLSVLTDQSSFWTWDPNKNGFDPTSSRTLAPNSTSPQYYLDNMSGLMPETVTPNPAQVAANVYRTPNGVGVQWYSGQWIQLGPPPTSGGPCATTQSCSPFPDTNCPATTGCFGSDPSYYETMRVASNLLGANDLNGYVLGRLRDGLHVYALEPQENGALAWNSNFPVLSALADPSSGTAPASEWSSIRTGDITGDGSTDVLALVNGQLQAWELTSNGSGQLSWTALPISSTGTLNLGGSLWQNNASYYSTFQVGPIAPGAPDAVIARGPFGVRTWFYNRNASGGWTSFVPQDVSSYPQFAGTQLAAWNQLNVSAKLLIPAGGTTIRDNWTNPPAPSDDDLTNVSNGVLVLAGCSGQTSANPPTYSACKVPAGGTGFSTSDWTAVVNETLAEIYDAKQTIDFFGQVAGLNRDTFLAKEAELPAIASSIAALGQAASNNSTPVTIQSIFSTGLGIAGSLAGLANPLAGATLGIASYIAGIIPSATPEVNVPPFDTTLNQLQNDLAGAITDAGKAVDVQTGEVLQNYGMLQMVAQLTSPSGLWYKFHDNGLKCSMDEGFALWAYKQLLPTVLERDVVTGCDPSGSTPDGRSWHCSWTSFDGSVPKTQAPNFTTLNVPHTTTQEAYHAYPCGANWLGTFNCTYNEPPTAPAGASGTDIASRVWDAPGQGCTYDGTAGTEWTFDCSLGVQPALSTDAVGGPANGWNLTTCTASPVLLEQPGPFPLDYGSCSDATSASATVGSTGSAKLAADVALPRGFRLRNASLSDAQFLHEPGGRGKLLSFPSGRALGTIRLSAGNGKLGGGRLGSPPGAPPITLTLQRDPHRKPRLTLSLSRLGVAVPYACQTLPASVSTTTKPFMLDTALALSDGHVTYHLSLPTLWTCVRTRSGAVIGLRTVAAPSPAQHRGLALSMAGPRAVVPGTIATFTLRVRNTRRGPANPYISSLWHILVRAGMSPFSRQTTIALPSPRFVMLRISQLRQGTTKPLRVRIRIPRALGTASIRRVCLSAAAVADSARPASARACSAVRAASTPAPTRLG